jgi:RimJ/RimL family protein N-acetyltransferase
MPILRDATDADREAMFELQRDPQANWMAAFGAKDPDDQEAHAAWWTRVRANPEAHMQTIEVDGQVAGSVSNFVMDGQREVSYWLGKAYWGRGLATWALSEHLKQLPERPLHARAAKDNIGSIRVLQKCGFALTSEDRGYSDYRQTDVDELLFTLA